MVLDKEACLLCLNTGFLKDDLEVTLKLFHVVLPVDVRTKERHIQEVGDEQASLLSTNSGSAG